MGAQANHPPSIMPTLNASDRSQRAGDLPGIELRVATICEKPTVDHLAQFYLYEFSQYMPSIVLDHEGRYTGLPDLDAYWDSPNHVPFLIHVDGELAGFALIIKGTDGAPHQVGEFFVVKKFSGKGVGTSIAGKYLTYFRGIGSSTKCGTTIRRRPFGDV